VQLIGRETRDLKQLLEAVAGELVLIDDLLRRQHVVLIDQRRADAQRLRVLLQLLNLTRQSSRIVEKRVALQSVDLLREVGG
jgi:hypothetical protein